MQPFPSGDRPTRKVGVLHHVRNPRGLAGHPHPPRQANAPCESGMPACRFEVGERDTRQMPGVDAAQDVAVRVDVPQRAVVPAKRVADGLEDPSSRFRKGCGFRQRARGDVFNRQASLGVSFARGVG